MEQKDHQLMSVSMKARHKRNSRVLLGENMALSSFTKGPLGVKTTLFCATLFTHGGGVGVSEEVTLIFRRASKTAGETTTHLFCF